MNVCRLGLRPGPIAIGRPPPLRPVRALVLAHGLLVDPSWVARYLAQWPDWLVVAADGGLAHARTIGLGPHLLIGDFDSSPPGRPRSLREIRHPKDKDETDLELALAHVAAIPTVRDIVVVGALGDRVDHALTNLDLTARWVTPTRRVCLLDGSFRLRFVCTRLSLVRETRFDTISLLPYSDRVGGITTWGLAFPLRHETLFRGRGRGVSNAIRGRRASIRIGSGLLIVVETSARGHRPGESATSRSGLDPQA